MITYSTATDSQRRRMESVISQDIRCCQSSLVDAMLENGMASVDDISSLYPEVDAMDDAELIAYIRAHIDRNAASDDYDDAEKMRDEIRDSAEPAEILEWWLITNASVVQQLRQAGECILDTDYGTWWGRTCSGQSIVLDPTWWRLYRDEVASW